jgi:uncharacterized membrane protein YdjX (TVP38/TMEM64 family)
MQNAPPPRPNRTAAVSPATLRRWRHVALAAFVLLLVATALGMWLLAGHYELTSDTFAGMMAAAGMWGLAIVVLLMLVHSFIPFPAELIAIAAGACFGFWQGTIAVWIGAMLGAALAFGLARALGRPFADAFLAERHRAAIDRWTEDAGATTLLVLRLVPIVAFNLINYAAGLTRVGWWTFLWTTGIGILPIAALSAWFGAHMRHLSVEWLVVLSVAGIATVIAGHVIWRKRHR